jgi:hypothetical protein
MAYENAPIKRNDTSGADRKVRTGYNEEIDRAKSARNSQLTDSDPMIEKDGFLGVDNLDKMRRRKIR